MRNWMRCASPLPFAKGEDKGEGLLYARYPDPSPQSSPRSRGEADFDAHYVLVRLR